MKQVCEYQLQWLLSCAMARKRSTFIKTKWSIVAPPNILSEFLEISCSKQNSLDVATFTVYILAVV